MNSTRLSFYLTLLAVGATVTSAQEDPRAPASLSVEPTEIVMDIGDERAITATVKDSTGNVIEDATVLYLPMHGQFWNLEERTWRFNLFKVSREGVVSASRDGDYKVLVRVAKSEPEEGAEPSFLEVEVPIEVRPAPIARLVIQEAPEKLYTETTSRLSLRAFDAVGKERNLDEVEIQFASSNPEIAAVSPMGFVSGKSSGAATITARSGEASASVDLRVDSNPITSLELTLDRSEVRTGDVVHLSTRLTDATGRAVDQASVTYSFSARVDPMVSGGPSSGLVTPDGRFVADLPGEYVLVASSGRLSDMAVLSVRPRDVKQTIELVGHGRVKDRATSDLWVWEGADGNDYAITGTHSASGHAYIWDVTDPHNMDIIDTVKVDARTVNDVKISEDGRIAVISREGASNRRNGLVILDVSEPHRGVRILSRYDDELTGGVHNIYVADGHIYALSGGQRYDIINIEDPENPHRVGRFALDKPDRSIHDVVVIDGVAYSANWNDGVVLVDVGGGGQGGSPTNPVNMGSFPFPTGWNHAVYPYRSESTGNFYIFAGDEASRTSTRFSPTPERGTGTPGYEGEPSHWRGWIHVLAWDEADEPELVARYEVPEAGSHNIWIEDDIMYVAFYNGGLRVVDVSGELLGDLYRQGREIARFLPFDPEGYLPNAPQVWGAQPHKGTIFFSDYNSGLWAVRLVGREETETEQ